jgi:lysyl endopeptidase
MRRTVGLLAAFCTLTGLAGVATAEQAPATHGFAAEVARTPQRIGEIEQVTGLLERTGRLVGGHRDLTLTYPGASYVKPHFSRMALRPGDRVVVSDRAGTESYTYTAESLVDGWAMSVTGDTAVVRLEQGADDPLGLRGFFAGLGLTVDKVARGFGAAEMKEAPARDRAESICGNSDDKRDAPCYKATNPVAYQKSKAVARLLINGVELCTAWRVGPNNRMFTNNHCASSTYDIRHTEVWFNYECAVCNGYEVLRSTKVLGDRLYANDSTLDFALFSVQNFQDVTRFGFLELDVRPARQGEPLFIVQHPQGLPTMIAMSDPGERGGQCAVDDPSYYGYDNGTDVSYFCDTEGGSSGSPVIAASTNKVIALHHFGGCPNSGVRIDLIYRRIAGLL